MKTLATNQFSMSELVEALMMNVLRAVTNIGDSNISGIGSGYDLAEKESDVSVEVDINDLPLDIAGLPYKLGSVSFRVVFLNVEWIDNTPVWQYKQGAFEYEFGVHSKNILLSGETDPNYAWDSSEDFNMLTEQDDIYFSQLILSDSLDLITDHEQKQLLELLWKEVVKDVEGV